MLSSITMAQAKRDFQIGYLTTFDIEAVPMSQSEWCLILKGGSLRAVLHDAKGKAPRHFKTLDAVIAAATDIGFKVQGLTMN